VDTACILIYYNIYGEFWLINTIAHREISCALTVQNSHEGYDMEILQYAVWYIPVVSCIECTCYHKLMIKVNNMFYFILTLIS